MSSINQSLNNPSFTNLSTDDKNCLLQTARKSIDYGLQHHRALPVEINEYNDLLKTQGASFVTLNLNKQLRGCIGTLEAHQPLITDVSEHAYAAAFEDPRFPKVTKEEVNLLEISISILTSPAAIQFTSEKDLLSQLIPNVDGIILESGFHKATFLPAVWEQLSNAEDFINHLKIKAGLDKHEWPDNLKISRYQAISIK